MRTIRNVGLIGGGAISLGWAARCLIHGLDVVLYDVADDREQQLDAVIHNAVRAYRKMTIAPVTQRGAVRFADSISETVAEVDFVQESSLTSDTPGHAILHEISAHTKPDVIIASSLPERISDLVYHGIVQAERVLVAKPLDPVYLVPLVEVVGGESTSQSALDQAIRFYRHIGLHPLTVARSVEESLASRLIAAISKEAHRLIHEDSVTADDIHQAISYGPGLWWASLGYPSIDRTIEPGERGPVLDKPTETTSILTGRNEVMNSLPLSLSEHGAHPPSTPVDISSVVQVERLRDDGLVAVMTGLRTQAQGAGGLLKNMEEQLYRISHPPVTFDPDQIRCPLRLHHDRVPPEWVDYNNHMSESYFLRAAGDASDALFRYIGVDEAYHAAGLSYFTVETHLCHLREMMMGQSFYIATHLLDSDEKRLHLVHSIHLSDDDALCATCEQMLLHVNTVVGRACPAKASIWDRVSRITTAHKLLGKPMQAGRSIAIQRKTIHADE